MLRILFACNMLGLIFFNILSIHFHFLFSPPTNSYKRGWEAKTDIFSQTFSWFDTCDLHSASEMYMHMIGKEPVHLFLQRCPLTSKLLGWGYFHHPGTTFYSLDASFIVWGTWQLAVTSGSQLRGCGFENKIQSVAASWLFTALVLLMTLKIIYSLLNPLLIEILSLFYFLHYALADTIALHHLVMQ